MFRLSDRLHRVAAAALLGLGVAASAQTAPGLDARLDRLTGGLTLTAEQQVQIDALGTRYADADRAGLWSAATDLADVLTDAQVAQLRQSVEAGRGERPDGERRARGERGGRGERGAGRRGRGGEGARGERAEGRRGDRPQLTDEQREALRAVRGDVRQQTEALVGRLRDGSITDAAFAEQVREIREAGARRSAELLPAEVAQQMAQRRAERDAADAARERALGLTAAQKARLQTLGLDRVRDHEPMDVRPYLDEDGAVDRDAMREAMRERREAQRATRGETRGETRDEAADVLTEEQRDLTFLYGALAGGRGMRGPGGGRIPRGR